jgi:O-antigen/teichoic acid export membrane protein
VRKLALLLLPLAGLLVVNARDIIEILFTSAYASSVPIFMLCALVLFPLALPIDSGLRVFAETRTLLALHLVTLLTVAASLSWLLSWLGIAGGIVSVGLSAAVAKGSAWPASAASCGCRRRASSWRAIGVVAAAAAMARAAIAAGRALRTSTVPPRRVVSCSTRLLRRLRRAGSSARRIAARAAGSGAWPPRSPSRRDPGTTR